MKKYFANLIKFFPPASAVLKVLRAGAILFAVGFIFLNFNINKTEAAACNVTATGTWTAAATGTATFSGCTGTSGYPAATDDLTVNSGVIFTISWNATLGSLTIANPTVANGVTLGTAGTTITVTNALTLTGGAGTVAETVQINGANTLLNVGSVSIGARTGTGASLITGLVATACSGTGGLASTGAISITSNSTSTGTSSITMGACKVTSGSTIAVTAGSAAGATLSTTSGNITATSTITSTGASTTAFAALVTTATGTISANGLAMFGGSNASGTGSITTTGAGTITTTNGVTFTGTAAQAKLTVFNNASSVFNITGALGAGGTISIGANSTTNFTGTSSINGTSYTIGGKVEVDSGTLTMSGATLTTITGTTLVRDTATMVLGNYAFTQTGNLTVGNGSSGILNGGSGSTGTYTFSAGITVAAGGTFNIPANGGTHAVTFNGTAGHNNSGTFNTGTGTHTLSGTGAFAFAGSSNMTYGNTFTIPTNRAVTNSKSGGTLTFSALTLASPTAGNSLTLNDGTNTTITGALTFTANNAANNQIVTLGSGAGAGNLSVGSIVTSASTSTGASRIACSSGGTGTLTVTGTSASSVSLSGSAVASSNGASIDFATVSSACNLTMSGTGGGITLTIPASAVGTAQLKMGTGTLTLNTGGLTFTSGTSQPNKCNYSNLAGATVVLNGTTLPVVGNCGSYTFASTTNLTSTNTSAINYATAVSTWGAITVSSGTLTFAAAPTATSVRVDSGATLALGGNLLTDSGNFTCGSGGAGTATISGSGGITVSGASSVLGLTNGAGSTCAVTNSGTFLVSGGTAPTVSANAAYTFTGSLSVTTALANSGTVTANNATSLVGAGNFTNASGGILNIAGTSTITTLSPAASANTINYTGTAQTVHAAATNPYWHLGFSGTGSNTISLPASVTAIAGNLALSGTSAVTTGAGLIVTGTTTIGDGTSLILGAFAFESDDKLTVGGGTSGTFNGTNGTGITLKGDLEIKVGSTFTKMTSGSVTFSKGAAQVITDSTSGCSGTATSCQEIGNVVTATASTSVSLTTNIEISSLNIAGSTTFDITSDTVAVSGTSGPLITNSGTFTTTSSTVQITPNASLTLTSGNITFNNLSLIPTLSSTSKAYTFGAGTLAIGGAFNINPTAGSALALTVTLGNSVTVTGATTITGTTSGTSSLVLLNGSSWDLTTSSLTISSAGTLNASSSSSTITLTGTGTVFSNSGTYTKGTDTIKFTDTSATGKTFAGGGGTFNNFWYAPSTGTGTLTITGANTFADFKDDGTGAHIIVFPSSTTQTIATLTLDTNASANITLQSSTSGSGQWTFSDPSGTNTVSYITIKDACVVNTGAVWDASNGTNTDGGNNCTGGTGWLFTNGISIAGSSNGSGTVAVAVNGTLQVGKTATISGSAWSITAVTTPAVNDIITVWIDGAADGLESTAVTKWSSGNITGMVLNTGVLTLGSSQNTSVSVTNLGLCDQDTGCIDEDIMHTSNSGALLVDANNVYTGETLSVLSGNTLTVASGSTESITTEKLNNAGIITATGTPTITINGTSGTLFTNSGTFTQATSTVNFSGNGSATINSGSPTFYNLTSSGTGTKTLGAAITVASSGTLTVSNGTFDPSTYLITGSGTNTLSVASGATLAVGASTFAGNYSAGFTTRTLTSGSTVDYNISGPQTIDNTLTYSNLSTSTGNTKTFGGTTVINGNFANGASVTLATGNNGLTFGGNFTNSGVALNAGSSTITINGTSTQSIAGFTTTGTITMSKTAGVATLQSAVSGNALTINGVGGTLNLGTSLTHTFSGATTVTNGTLNAGSSNISTTALSSSNANTRAINLGSGIWTLTSTGTVWDMATSTGSTVTAGTSTIKLTDASATGKTFAGGGKTYYNLWLASGAGSGSYTISGDNTFADFKDDGTVAHSILFTVGSTTHVTTFTVNGHAGQLTTINSTTTGTHALVKDGGGVIISDYLSLQHSVATPASTWYATNSTNNQGVTTVGSGWLFTTPPCVSIVSSGAWNTTGTWACAHVPTTSDDVTIQSGHTITMNVNSAVLGAITVNGTLNTSDGSTRTLSGASLTIGASGTLNAIGDSLTITGDVSNAGTLNINKMTVYYRAITINPNVDKVPNTNQTDFPVLITGTYDGTGGTADLRTVANGGKVQNTNGYDIGFYSDSGLTTKLKWETVKYTASTGVVEYWVKIPSLSYTASTVIYMGYGNPSITTDQSDRANTWNTAYKAVYHMGDNATNGTITDSIGNSNETNSVNTSTVTTTGKIGSAISNAGSDYASGSYNSAMNLTAGVTLSAWVYFNDVTGLHTIVGKPYAGTHTSPYWEWFMGSASSGFGSKYVVRIGNTEILSNTAATTGTWHHIVETADGTNIKQYIDGVLDKTTADSTLPSNSNSIGVRIGANVANGENMNGNIDQIEVSSSARSADWITTQYNNQSSPSTFYTVASESTTTALITPTANGSGQYYRPITIDYTKVSTTDQTDFPVMIKDTFDGSSGKPDLRTVANGGKVQNANGYDIGFYSDSALTTKLKWETVSYSATTGTAEYWVKIPTLSYTTNTIIYIGYGSSSITTDQSDPTNVWDSNFKATWHLKDGTTLSGNDSTSAGLTLTQTSSPTAVSGKIDGGANLGTTGRLQLTNTAIDLTTFTYEGWLDVNGDTAGYFFERGPGGSAVNLYLWYQPGNNRWVFGFNNGTSYVDHYYSVALPSGFHHYAYVMDDTNNLIKLYIDGAQVVSEAETTSPSTSPTQVLNIGSDRFAGSHFDAYVDEIRISSVARSTGWITTGYNNTSSPTSFYSFGSEVAPSNGTTTTLLSVGGNWTNTGTVYPSTSTIKLTYSGSSNTTFAGGSQTYYNLWLAHGTGSGSYTISGNNIFSDFKDDGTVAHSILFTTGSTQHVTTWTASGHVGQLLTINSTDTGTHALVKDDNLAVNADYLNIQHSVATPIGVWFAGNNSINNQSITTAGNGWLFEIQTIYKGGGGSGGGEASSPSGSGASGTAVLSSNTVASVTINAGGSGYTIPPSVSFCGGGGTGAAGTAVLSGGAVASVTITNSGSSYSTPPTVSFGASCGGGGEGGGGGGEGGGSGSGATGTAVLTNNVVTSVTINAGGSGYTIAPSVAFCGGGGTGAVGTAVLSGNAVASVTINSGGSGYSSPPTVSFGASCPGGGGGGGGGDSGFLYIRRNLVYHDRGSNIEPFIQSIIQFVFG